MAHSSEPPKDGSRAWEKGKLIFRETLNQNDKPHPDNVDRFLRNNFLLTTAISNCEGLKSSAEGKYNTKKNTPKFVSKLLDVLVTIKEVGDPFLSNGPETVSIAWCAISTLITIAAKDKEDCEFISEACTNVVTIVLNCRLYERRYDPVTEAQVLKELEDKKEEEKNDTDLGDLEKELKMALPRVIALVLEFAWYTQLRLNENRAVRMFKETFSPKLKEKYELLMAEYVKLRSFSQDAFQERVMNSAADLANKIDNLNRILFPEIKEYLEQLRGDNREIRAGVQQSIETGAEVKLILTEGLVNQKFEQYRMMLKPTLTHETLFNTTLRPIPTMQLNHLCHWLFENEHYKRWESPKIPNTPSIFYIQGRPGFGKSVMMACAVRRLLRPDHDGLLAYFFFKKGDDSSQRAENALSSIAAQLYNQHIALEKGTKEQFIKVMEDIALDVYTAKEKMKEKEEHDKPGFEIIPSNPDINKVMGSLAFTSQHLKKLIQEIGKYIRKTVYLVVDAIDECVDQQNEGLVPLLVDIVNSPDSPFKVIMSTRENAEHEKYLITGADSDTVQNEAQNHDDPFHLRLVKDAVMLTVTEDTNAADMKIFLESNLIKLITRSKEDKKKPPGKKLRAAVSQVAETIKLKANGMFTYSAMVIASLKQPSRMKLTERLRRLPDGMDELYRKRLSLLTGEERELVALALKRIVFSFGPVRTLEIAEEFKRVYQDGHIDDDHDQTPEIAINYEDSEYGSEIDPHESDKQIKQNNQATDTTDDRSSITAAEGTEVALLQVPKKTPAQTKKDDLLLKAMREPEIADTIYHLEHTGRDFFKFSMDKSTIDTIHKSIRDWVENETRQIAAELDQNAGTVASLFTWDDSGQLRLSLPIPSVYSRGQSGGLDFQSERETHLDILIYLLEVLTNPGFQEKYMPYYAPKKPTSTEEEALEALGDLFETPTDAKPENESDTPPPLAKHDDICQRYEIRYWQTHMQRVHELWQVSDRKGEKWNRLKALLHKFVEPDNFRRWVVQYWRFIHNKTLEEAIMEEYVFSPLHIAGYWGLELLAEHLIDEEHVDVNTLDGKGQTVLHMRVSLGHPEVVKKVLTAAYDTSLTADQITPVGEIVYTLHQTEFDPNNKDTRAMLQSMKYLIEKGTDINEKNPYMFGEYLLHTIVSIGEKEIFDLLINNPKLEINVKNWAGETPLHACFKNAKKSVTKECQLSIAEALIKAGADVNAQDNSSNGPLYFAVRARSVKGARLLLEKGAEIEDDNNQGETAMTSLPLGFDPWTSEEAFAIVQLLLSYGANIDAIDRVGNTALMLALWQSHFDLAEVLMAKNIEKFGEDRSFLLRQNTVGEAPLYFAGHMSTGNGLRAAKLVVKHIPKDMYKTFLEQRSTTGFTPFEHAIKSYRFDVASYYWDLASGTDIVMATDSSGQTMMMDVCRDFVHSKFPHDHANRCSGSPCNPDDTSILETLLLRLVSKYGGSPPDKKHTRRLQHTGIMLGSESLLRTIASSDIPLFLNNEEDTTEPLEQPDIIDIAYFYGQTELIQRILRDIKKYAFEPEIILARKFLQPSKLLYFGDDKSNPSTGLTLVAKSDTLERFSSDRVLALTEPVFYCEFQILKIGGDESIKHKANIRVGFNPSFTSLNTHLGDWRARSDSFGYCGSDGRLYSPRYYVDDSDQSKPFSREGDWTYGEGDTVGCGYDNTTFSIFYTKNGELIGTGFEDVKVALFLGFSSTVECEVKLNLGVEPFLWEGLEGRREEAKGRFQGKIDDLKASYRTVEDVKTKPQE